jgi:hypothetical protein
VIKLIREYRLPLATVLLSITCGQAAGATECQTYYANTGAFEVFDSTAQNSAAVFLGGIVGSLLSGKAEANNSEREIELKTFMQAQGKYVSDEDLKTLSIYNSKDLEKASVDCVRLFQVDKNLIGYDGSHSLNRQFFTFSQYQHGREVFSTKFDKTSNLGIRAWPITPSRKFKADKSGKMVEVTRLPEGSATYHPKVYAAFQGSSLKNLEKAIREVAAK